MSFILYYILAGALLFASYELFLKDSKWFRVNRVYILIAPLLPIFILGITQYSSSVKEFSQINPVQLDELVIFPESSTDLSEVSTNIPWLWMIYGGVSILIFLNILFAYLKAKNLMRQLEFKDSNDFNGRISYSETADNFSFFNKIHINKGFEKDDFVLQHEICHVRAKHSYDILLYNLFKVLFWFNPFVFLFERRLKLIHEFQADDYACSLPQKEEYANSLLNQVFGTSSIQFINQFNNQKSIKMRLKMLKVKSSKKKGLKYLSIIPLFGFVFMLGAWNSEQNPISFLNFVGEEEVLDKVEKMPEFEGGMDGLMKYMLNEVKYPKTAQKDGTEGRVYIEFVVNKKGEITKPSIKKGVDPRLDAEALRVVSSMPNWTPGEDKGKKVSVKMVLPISFKLAEEK